MDITEFYETFFEEAEELLGDMERHLLELDLDEPDPEQLNAIFRAAHSIKGGAGTFGFSVLQETTHMLENLLDYARQGELTLRTDIVDLFLETKDMLHDQLNAYRNGDEPDPEAFARICQTLKQLALEELGRGVGSEPDAEIASPEHVTEKAERSAVEEAVEQEAAAAPQEAAPSADSGWLRVVLLNVSDKDRELLVEELGNLGTVTEQHGDAARYEVVLESATSRDDIEAVMCFIVEPEQLSVAAIAAPAEPTQGAPETTSASAVSQDDAPVSEAPAAAERAEAPAEEKAPARAATGDKPANAAPGGKGGGAKKKTGGESATIRVPVEKVDQIINLVGELIITQSMLDQTASELDVAAHGPLVNGMNLLQRNARDLQESVMSIRMVPMDYVFSRFPRLVRDLTGKLGKDIELVTEGQSTELDKSLTERIIDPLTHLVRNSLDHGIEMPDEREAAGKPRTGQLTLSAQHQGGNILIEVKDDGGGLNREKILAKAAHNGLTVSDSMSDDEVWQLIFAAGFSTADQVSDVSGRGVGMDVVKRNIQAMGGHVEIQSWPGKGTTTRVVLPLTLAILDGMSIKSGPEIFILPLSAVLESLQPSNDDIYSMAGNDKLLKVRDEYLPLIALYDILNIEGAEQDPTQCIAVILQAEGRRYALLVDDLVGQQQVVVKNLETNYRKVPAISAATILGDGSVALILDVADINRLHRQRANAPKHAELTASRQEDVVS
ncbi:CheA signal transduction histidine kinase [Chromohalobacter marismortui]|uniref:Chemotaxis protein CheA n=1 Tax=Chromohalobacter marismortui TaxID=42055 RepID=A0A4R7NQC5_9GAMM|nr:MULTISPECIES: chemotaxis protein CheA [Chromohalobacter]MCI0508791.1 chemotaxis protein CheA [Chromohalobacter sp.]MCI0592011.1 chemotaxis protein CheA [Chromohalobacter sp.]TDU22842.1 CheA signal transduction histidine kinase [Chromohalobacter marismortui]